MRLELTQETSAVQTMRVSPRLVAANYILELSSLELQEAINTELSENPALELLEVATCAVCGTELQGSICPRCLQRQKGPDLPQAASESDFDELVPPGALGSADEFDPITQVPSEETLAERLLRELGTVLDEGELAVAEYLIGSLDEKGYLSCSVEEAADELNVGVEQVRRVLSDLQSQEPVGIGARNLRECLLIQLARLERGGMEQPHTRVILEDHLLDLGEHKFSKIAHELKISTDAVAAVWQFVKSKLNPHPGHGFSPTNDRDRDTRSMYVVPDVIIGRKDDEFEVDVVESRRFFLRLSPMYAHLGSGRSGSSTQATLAAHDRKHVQQYVSRAKLFMANINQRRQTLQNITRCLVERQGEYLREGVRHLKPLSRAAVAETLGLHESTVSRATAAKYVMLPNGEVIPFSHFFTPSLSVKDVMKEVIERENRPLTDAEIMGRLEERDIHIARRTVAKYRMQLNILPSSFR